MVKQAPKPRLASDGIRVRTLHSLRNRDYLFLWLATLTIGGGFWGHQLVVGWLTFNLTHSPLLTALVLGLDSLPYLLAAPIAGAIADSWDRRKTLAVTAGYQAAVTAGFSALVLMGELEVWHIFAFALAIGPSWSIAEASKAALIPSIVPRRDLVNAFALREVAFSSTRLVVPGVAGVVTAAWGPGGALVMVATLYLGGLAAIAAIRADEDVERQTRPGVGLGRFVEGARYVKDEPLVKAVVLLQLLPALLIFPVVPGLMPVYASEVYEVGPGGLGILLSAVGVGALVGPFVIASLGDVRRKGRVLLLVTGIAAAGIVSLSQSSSILLAVPALAMVSGGVSSSFALSAAIVLKAVPDNLRGRVWSLALMAFGLIPLGGLLMGGLAELLDAQSATFVAGAIMLLILVSLSAKLKSLWKFG